MEVNNLGDILPLDELQRELADLEKGSFISLTDSELQAKVNFVHKGFIWQAPVLPSGTPIYRAVRIPQRPTHKARIGYPPIEVIKSNGRLNRVGEVMFYGAVNQFAACLQECSWQVGEFFAVSAWFTTQPMLFNHLGYSTATFEAVKTRRDLPAFGTVQQDTERNALIREWQARVFTQHIPSGKEHLYRLTIALKNFALSKIAQPYPGRPDAFSGVIYPSVATWLLADNIAILPSEVDNKMALFEVVLLTLDFIKESPRADGGKDTEMSIKPYDFARADKDGKLVWGQTSQVFYPCEADISKPTPLLLAPEAPQLRPLKSIQDGTFGKPAQ